MVSQCSKCPLNTAPYNPGLAVPGIGASDAMVFILGEAPGATEASVGKPFVGKAGKVLQEIMSETGYSLDKVFITNTVKHRPPDNRDPTDEERAQCLPYLEEQILAVDPEVIIALGKQATFSLATLAGVDIPKSGLRGHTFTLLIKDKSYPVLSTWHPSYVMRNTHKPEIRNQLKSDLQAVLNLAETTNGYNMDKQKSCL